MHEAPEPSRLAAERGKAYAHLRAGAKAVGRNGMSRTMLPLCFVLMPFGRKSDEQGRIIDFDQIYAQVLRPSIEASGLEPIRADEEIVTGFIHKQMYERLMLCDFAIADLTSGNANVYYELGVRHGIRPHSTMLVFAEGTRLPFDLAPLRGLPYRLDTSGAPDRVDRDRAAIAAQLRTCFGAVEDSPLFQLVPSWPRADLEPLRRSLGSGVLEELQRFKLRLERAREAGADEAAIAAIEAEVPVPTADPAIIVNLLAAYRAVNAFQAMVNLIVRAPPLFARTVFVREQHAFALNRLGRRREAEQILLEVIAECGPNPETNGLLGRVYKDGWRDAVTRGQSLQAASFLGKAINAYLRGFEADWRQPYPALNAATLMEAGDSVDPRQRDLLPVICYAARQRAARPSAGYWEFASLVEACVLVSDRTAAHAALADALTASDHEGWFMATTADNIRIIAEGRARRGLDVRWIEAIEADLRGGT